MNRLKRLSQAIRDSGSDADTTAACDYGAHYNCSGSVYRLPWRFVGRCKCACHSADRKGTDS